MSKFFTLITLLFIITACNPAGTSQPALDSEALAKVKTEGIEVTFTGDECTYTGPAVLPEGEYLLIFNSLDERVAADFYVQRINDGKTYQDIVDLQGGEPGNYYDMPDFISYAKKVGTETDNATGEERTTYAFEEGQYYIDAFKLIDQHMAAWLCGSFMIVSE